MDASIIIPTFNVEKFLGKCLDGAINQTFKGNYEIIVIDDGSTDQTREIAKNYAKKYKSIQIIEQKNKGAGAARNIGLDNARGEIILFLDSDDMLLGPALEKCVNHFEHHDDGLVYSDQEEMDYAGKKILGERKRSIFHPHLKKLIYFFHFPGHVRAVPKEKIKDIRFRKDLILAQDWDFTLQINDKYNIGHIPQVLYIYRTKKNTMNSEKRSRLINYSASALLPFLKKFYSSENVEIIPMNKGNNILWYEHIINSKRIRLDKKFADAWVSYQTNNN